jgi:hypothetical protein
MHHVSFIGFILLTKSLSCNVTVLTGIPFISESSKYLEFISLIWKEPYYDKFQCHKLQEGNSKVSERLCKVFQLSKSRNPCFRPDGPEKCLDALLCREDSISSALHLLERQGNTSRYYSMFEENPDFLCKHGSEKTACNPPNTRATSSKCGLNMETCEARYGKKVAQFTIRTLFASIQTLPREIQISSDLGLLSL